MDVCLCAQVQKSTLAIFHWNQRFWLMFWSDVLLENIFCCENITVHLEKSRVNWVERNQFIRILKFPPVCFRQVYLCKKRMTTMKWWIWKNAGLRRFKLFFKVFHPLFSPSTRTCFGTPRWSLDDGSLACVPLPMSTDNGRRNACCVEQGKYRMDILSTCFQIPLDLLFPQTMVVLSIARRRICKGWFTFCYFEFKCSPYHQTRHAASGKGSNSCDWCAFNTFWIFQTRHLVLWKPCCLLAKAVCSQNRKWVTGQAAIIIREASCFKRRQASTTTFCTSCLFSFFQNFYIYMTLQHNLVLLSPLLFSFLLTASS